MARIEKYLEDDDFSFEDKVVGSSYVGTVNGVKKYKTRNFSLETIRERIGDKTYVHTQALSAATWTIHHNLAKNPSIVVVDSSGNTVLGDVEYVDTNTVTLSFSGAFEGKAYLN